MINHTPYPHLLYRGCLDENKMIASVALKVTYEIVGEQMVIAKDQVWLMQDDIHLTEYGEMDGDRIWKRGGTDIFILGKAYAPGGQPTQRMRVAVSIKDKLSNSLMVTGNRKWTRTPFGIKMTEPELFSEMPLTNAQAFGGVTQWDELDVPHPINPAGKGFIWEEEDAPGTSLPNIEDPTKLITDWKDKAPVVGFVPIARCERKMMHCIQPSESGSTPIIQPKIFNNAFWEMIVDELKDGEVITVEGMSKTAHKQNVIIPDHQFDIALQIGDKHYDVRPYIEQVGIETDYNRAFILYRYAFRYEMIPHQKRTIEIKENHGRI